MVIPLLIKSGLDPMFKNLRAVSNLAYISKLTERAVFNQKYDHLVRSGLYPLLQSAYRQCFAGELSRSASLCGLRKLSTVSLMTLSSTFHSIRIIQQIKLRPCVPWRDVISDL